RTIDQSDCGKLCDRNAKECWALLEDLSLYDNKSWNDPRDFAKLVKAIVLPEDISSTSDRRLIELENQVQRLMELILLRYNLLNWTKSLSHVRSAVVPTISGKILKDVEVYIAKLKLLDEFYVIDMKKDPETPLLVGRGFLATVNAIIDCRMAKIAVGEGITRSVFGVKEVDLGEEEAPYWTTLGKKESYKLRPRSNRKGTQNPLLC
nr:MAK10-like protein [Tanacetum cinerariifolium]